MNIAITGATGLLGSNLANYYAKSGHQVFILLKDEFYNVDLKNNINKIYGNVNNKSDVDYFIQKSLPDYFIHLAAQTQAYDSLKYPYNTFYTNMIGTLNVLESLREFSRCKSIIVASSDKAYGELSDYEYSESHPLNGIYPYDASKSITDIISKSYKMTYAMPIITTRACNMYGKGDNNKERLIPGIINSYLNKVPFLIRNGGEDVREYINVMDVVSAYDAILIYGEENKDVDSFNISSGDRFTTLEIFHMVENAIGIPVDHKIINLNSMEIKKQFMNSNLLTEKTGWVPKYGFRQSLIQIVKWYLKDA
jgi:CDP-glucose 4,6-dehydratase